MSKHTRTHARTHTHTHSRYQKGKTNLDFTEARDSEWQWHQLGRMQVCTQLQTDNHASTPAPNLLHAGCPSAAQPTEAKHCRPTLPSPLLLCQYLDPPFSSKTVRLCTRFRREFEIFAQRWLHVNTGRAQKNADGHQSSL